MGKRDGRHGGNHDACPLPGAQVYAIPEVAERKDKQRKAHDRVKAEHRESLAGIDMAEGDSCRDRIHSPHKCRREGDEDAPDRFGFGKVHLVDHHADQSDRREYQSGPETFALDECPFFRKEDE